jgi:DNA-binding response OmpR family regulator
LSAKVLIVDDEIDSLKLIGLLLESKGYQIVAAQNGERAIEKALQEPPDLVILDVMMPGMSGYEVCRRLRTNPQTATIPILMFTAKTQVMDKVIGFEAGADEYLTKPIQPAELLDRVEMLLTSTAEE